LATPDNRPEPHAWRKSTRSQHAGCVEVAFAGGLVHVRNSRDPRGATLAFTAPEWEAFLAGANEHEFDGPAARRQQ
jgi:hypothetical protein